MTTQSHPIDLPLPPRLTRRIPWRVLFGSDRIQFLRFVDESSRGLPLVRLRFGPRTVLLIKDSEIAGEVLLGKAIDFAKGPELGVYSRPLLGRGLLTSEGEFHRRQRQMINPVFAHGRIVGYADIMTQATEELVADWPADRPIDIAAEMTRLTLRIVGETLFGVTGLSDDADELGHSLAVAMRYFVGVIRSPLRPPFATIPFWRRDVARAMARLDDTIFRLIAQRRDGGAGNDLMSLLFAATDENGEPMPDRQIRDEAMTLFLAGHETTANALAWTFYLLARHPEIYARVQPEIDAALNGRTPTHADLDRIPYTLQVIKEAIRLYPPAFAFVRQAVRETSIGGYQIPVKASLIVSTFLIHRNPVNFPDPERFDPDRFSPEIEKTRPRFSYLPFGGGVRVCIGASFALMEAHLIVATILQRVRLTLVEPDREQPTETLITLRPKGGIAMRATPLGQGAFVGG